MFVFSNSSLYNNIFMELTREVINEGDSLPYGDVLILIDRLKTVDPESADYVSYQFNLCRNEFGIDYDMQTAISNLCITYIQARKFKKVEWVENYFSLSSEQLNNYVIQALNNCIAYGWFVEFDEIRSQYEISIHELNNTLQSALMDAYLRCGKDSSHVISIIQQLKVSPEIIQASDVELASTLNALTARESLGAQKLINKTLKLYFPETHNKLLNFMLENIREVSNEYKYFFVTNLNAYYEQPWALEYLYASVASSYEAAKEFVKLYISKKTDWFREPWANNVFKKAEETVARYMTNNDVSYKYDQRDEIKAVGFSESNMYINHPYLLTEKHIKSSAIIADLMIGSGSDKSFVKDLGLDEVQQESLLSIISTVKQVVNEKYQTFFESIPDIDTSLAESLNSPMLPPLLTSIYHLAARYIVQSVPFETRSLPDIEQLTEKLGSTIESGLNHYAYVYHHDIPLYDKLYEEFDELRNNGDYPLEVYLGRDGVYAWIGRRTQDIARRRNLGFHGRSLLRQSGELFEIRPKYIVYPSYFKRNLSNDAKIKYLEQEGIDIDSNPYFFDTGYIGSIPENIMLTMNFSKDEIEKRIKLLFARQDNRRMGKISDNVSKEIVDHIEDSPKPEFSAEGLYIDDYSGKIKHIAKPTDPSQQFCFSLIRQAIQRHYWLKERGINAKNDENISE